MLDIIPLKIIILAALFVDVFCIAFIPVKLVSVANSSDNPNTRRKLRRFISLLSCFAAGVFLAAVFLDLYPEVYKLSRQVLHDWGVKSQFPLAEFLMTIGLFVILTIEQTVLAYKESRPTIYQRLNSTAGFSGTYGATASAAINAEIGRREFSGPSVAARPMAEQNEMPPSMPANGSNFAILSDCAPDSDSSSEDDDASSSSTSDGSVDLENVASKSPGPTFSTGNDELAFYKQNIAGRHNSVVSEDDRSAITENSVHHDPSSHSRLRSLILLLALSLHSIFEGLAVGLQPTAQDVLKLFGALAIHKSIVAFSLGISLVQSKFTAGQVIKSNFGFSITTPIGIGLGMAIMHVSEGNVATVVAFFLQGLACGTFLYVTFFEILPHEFNRKRNRLLKLLSLIVGFALIAVLVLVFPDDDED